MSRKVVEENIKSLPRIKPKALVRGAMGSSDEDRKEFETIIIGAGQTGLSVGRYLKKYGRPFIILDKNSSLGESWARRYDSLTLDSFAKYTRLEDFPFPGDQARHPVKNEVIEYLRSFAKHFDLRPRFSTEVFKIEKEKNYFILTTTDGIYRAKHVVLATGAFDKPRTPELSRNIPPEILQIHAGDYRNPQSLRSGAALVVGGGNSGAEIAEELAESGRKVYFSFKGKFRSVRSSPLSQWLAYRLGLAHVPKHTLLGKIIIWYTRGKAIGVDVKSLLRHPNITPIGPVEGDMRDIPADVSNVVWATGYDSDFSIISIPGFNPEFQRRGVTNIPRLFVLNIRWQYSKSSSHLAGVSRDARYIAKWISHTSSSN